MSSLHEIIPIIDNDGQKAVSLRALYGFLEVKARFTDWAHRMFSYGFTEGVDYVEILLPKNEKQDWGGHNRRDWACTLDMAKEISMIQRTPKGKEARQYFIEVEKKAIAGFPSSLSRMDILTMAIESEQGRIQAEKARDAMESYAKQLEPKADFYSRFIDGDGTYSVANVAKMLGLSQNKLFQLLRNHGVLIAKGNQRNTPYQKYMHHFAVKAYTYTRQDGTTGDSYTTRVQPSGLEFISRKLGIQIQQELS